MTKEIINQPIGTKLIESNGTATQAFYTWIESVTRLAEPLEGNGSPEGVLTAPRKTQYLQLDGASGSALWIKQASDIGGDRSQGWVLS